MATDPRAEGLAPVFRLAITAFVAISIIGAIFLAASLFVVAGNAKRAGHAAIADLCAEQLRAAGNDVSASGAAVRALQARFGLEGIEVADGEHTFTAGDTDSASQYLEERVAGGRHLEIRFTDHEMRRLGRIARIVLAAGGAATIGGLILFFSLLFSSGGSRTEASGVQTYLLEMHTREKERADALATITETLVRSLTSGFISFDEGEKLLDLNGAAREILALAPDAPVRNRRIGEVPVAPDFARVLGAAIEARASLQRVEIANVNGRTIGLTTVPLLDPTRRYLGMLALFTDLTPVRQLETRLRDMQSLADLGEMSAGIAHEFRNSLSTVLGYLRLAQKSNVPPEAEERIRRAESEARLLSAAVESLLTFARPMNLQTRLLDVTELLSETAERLRPLSSTLEIEVKGDPLRIEGDSLLLGRAFENLIRNAAESIQERGVPGRIAVEVNAAGQTIRISDNGTGIDDAEASRLFLPFRSTKPNGFGLGLALTRKIVLLHGGTISLTGRRGEGATVRIDFQPLR